jgi:hypothetical protein
MKPDESTSGDQRDIVVFSIVKASACSECGEELARGSLLRMQGESPLCIDCADLGRLVFLPSGDVALTRRSRKYSSLWAVVVRFSRARGRYERQGLLVERAALERAEAECLTDEESRRAARERAAEYRKTIDATYVEEFTAHVRRHFPGCPPQEAAEIAMHACEKYSGRIGRSASAKDFDESAVELAVRAHIRHSHTTYEWLLARGRDRDTARAEIADAVTDIVERWKRGSRNEETPSHSPQTNEHLGR